MTSSNKSFPRGSEWRKWDLHVHSPKTHLANGFSNCSTDDFVNRIGAENISVVGLTNYFKFDEYEFEIADKLRQRGITVFLNLEFRIEQTNKEKDYIHLHILFSDSVTLQQIKDLSTRLQTIGGKFCNALTKEDINNQIISLSHLKKTLQNEQDLKKDDYCLIACPRGHGNFRPSSEDDGRGNEFAKIIDQEVAIVFGNKDDQEFFLKEDRFEGAKSKPVFSCSDTHKLEDIGTKFTWIKADPTWEGLKQVLVSPEDRVFIGEHPEKQTIVEKNKNKFIDRIEIRLKEGKRDQPEKWFDGTNLQLNHDLVAIIGNKGSGKSALADVLAFVDGKKKNDFSFLTKDRFGEKDRMKSFEACFWWKGYTPLENIKDFIALDLCTKPIDLQSTKLEYIPQHYFEILCTEPSQDESNENPTKTPKFEEEIHRIIFSHITDRQGTNDLRELLSFKLKEKASLIEQFQTQISEKNQEILAIENKLSKSYQEKIKINIEDKKKEISNLGEAPLLTQNPIESSETVEATDKLRGVIKALEAEIECIDSNIQHLNSQRNNLTKLEESQEGFQIAYESFKQKYDIYSTDLDIEFCFVDFIDSAEKQKEIIKQKISDLENIQKEKNSQKSIKAGEIINTNEELQKLISSKSEAIKIEEDQKNKFEQWKKDKQRLDSEIQQLSEKQDVLGLKSTLDLLYEERWKISKQIFDKILECKKEWEGLLSPLKDLISSQSHILENKISFDVSIRAKELAVKIFDSFTQNKGKTEFQSDKKNSKIEECKKHNFTYWESSLSESENKCTKESIRYILGNSFLKLWSNDNEVQLDKLKDNLKDPNKIKELYDYLFGLEYLQPFYEIRYETKTLGKLSSGERGALLLTFYLLLDTNEYPIIIDQPEANLDNESIVTKLEPLIKQAKKRRQIIIVTHNPNIALCCDAEQIIYCEHNSDEPSKSIKYTSGSIESKEINEKLLKILEGGRMAFDTRDKKYIQTNITH